MSLKKNILVNYASQLYATAIGILMVPMYIQYMGAEAYGLLGFFAMLQVLFGLLDVGLTPTIARESARFQGGAITAIEYRRLTRALEGIFFGVALIGFILLFVMASPIASGWLNAFEIPMHEITQSLQLIAFIVALRWMSGMYRGVITGGERLVWLSGFNSLVASGRFVLVLPFLIFVSPTALAFFTFQLAIAICELVGLAWMAYRLLPTIEHGQRIQWEWAPLKPVLKFSLSIAFTSSVWVLVTQADKLVLSGILSLSEYGLFTLAVMVASGIMILTAPVSTVIMPRMARLHATGKNEEIIQVYRNATQLVSVVAGTASLALAFFSEGLLYVWTGDKEIAVNASPIMSLYAIGNGVLAVAAFPYYLQYALGNLRYHLIGNLITLIIFVPSIIWAASLFGAIGAAWVWLIINGLYFVVWVSYVHYKLKPGLHISWLLKDVLSIYTPVLFFFLFISNQINFQTRFGIFFGVALTFIFGIFIAIASSSSARKYFNNMIAGIKV